MQNRIVSFYAIAPLLLLIIIGFFSRHKGLLRSDALPQLNSLAFTIFLPALLFNNLYTTNVESAFSPRLIGYAVFAALTMYGLAVAVVCLLEKDSKNRGAMIQAIYRSNFVLLGLPIVQTLFAGQDLGATSVVVAVIVPIFNVLAVVTLEVFRGGRVKWGKVLLGLAVSVLGGVWGGRLARRAVKKVGWGATGFRKAQIPGAALTALLHGAQDGQKFLGIFLLGAALARGQGEQSSPLIPLWLMALGAVFMALGTLRGGRRSIDRVGREMVALGPREGLAADLGNPVCLLGATWLGLPVSTTHTRTAALLGVGVAGGGPVRWEVARGIALAWVLTFPACMALGYVLTGLMPV